MPPQNPARRIAAVLLAAGRSSRMAPQDKLLQPVGTRAMLRLVAEAATDAGLAPVIAVTASEAVDAALAGLEVEMLRNAAHDEGIASSIRAGVAALPRDIDAAVFLLGDMPLVNAAHLRRLTAAFAPEAGRSVCVPTHRGLRGNPVLWGAAHFPRLLELRGDRGARVLFGEVAQCIVEVEMDDDAVLVDIDTAEALAQLRARLESEPRSTADVAEALSDELFVETIEALAQSRGAPLENPDAQARVRNPLCGDEAAVALRLAFGRIEAAAYEVRGCTLCAAAATALRDACAGSDLAELAEAESFLRACAGGKTGHPPPRWPQLAVFAPLAKFPGRLACVLLPLEALRRALQHTASANAHTSTFSGAST